QYFSGRKSMMDWYSNLIFERLKRS
ncbi:integrase, partial [Escherichia coli]|nr:integrase [Escherichia coli]